MDEILQGSAGQLPPMCKDPKDTLCHSSAVKELVDGLAWAPNWKEGLEDGDWLLSSESLVPLSEPGTVQH